MRNEIETLEQALAYLTPGEGTNGPVILSPDKMRKAVEIIQAALKPSEAIAQPAIIYDQVVDFGDAMTVADFLESVEGNMFIDYDGHGYPMLDGKYARIRIKPSMARFMIPDNATHIVWYNR